MSLLLNLIPWWGRALAMLALVGVVWGHGFVKGVDHEEVKLDKVTTDLAVDHAKDIVAVAKKNDTNKEKLDHVVQDFHSNIAALNDYWVRKSAKAAAAPRVPQVPAAPAGVASTCTDPAPAGRDEELEKLKQECAVTTAMFNACQSGWISQEK